MAETKNTTTNSGQQQSQAQAVPVKRTPAPPVIRAIRCSTVNLSNDRYIKNANVEVAIEHDGRMYTKTFAIHPQTDAETGTIRELQLNDQLDPGVFRSWTSWALSPVDAAK